MPRDTLIHFRTRTGADQTNTKTVPAGTVRAPAVATVAILAFVWLLGMSNVIHLPLALVWILPFTCLIVGAVEILWEAGAFDTQ